MVHVDQWRIYIKNSGPQLDPIHFFVCIFAKKRPRQRLAPPPPNEGWRPQREILKYMYSPCFGTKWKSNILNKRIKTLVIHRL